MTEQEVYDSIQRIHDRLDTLQKDIRQDVAAQIAEFQHFSCVDREQRIRRLEKAYWKAVGIGAALLMLVTVLKDKIAGLFR